MVTKPNPEGYMYPNSSVLAKILMVTKLRIFDCMVRFCSVLAKILMVTKQFRAVLI